MNLSTMCWLQPAHSGISAGRQPPSAPPPPAAARDRPGPPPPGVAAARRRTRGWPGERPEKYQYSFKFVGAATCEPLPAPRSAGNPGSRTPGEEPRGTGENEKGSEGNGINGRAEPPAKLQRNYFRLFFLFIHFQKSPANNGGVAREGSGKKLLKIMRIALKIKTQ